jgi:hypothetical protein
MVTKYKQLDLDLNVTNSNTLLLNSYTIKTFYSLLILIYKYKIFISNFYFLIKKINFKFFIGLANFLQINYINNLNIFFNDYKNIKLENILKSNIINNLKVTTCNYDEHNIYSVSLCQKKSITLSLLSNLKKKNKINFEKNVNF